MAGVGEQGWRSGESARLPPMCPGLREDFPRALRFSPLLKNQHFQIPILAWKVSPISARALEDIDT